LTFTARSADGASKKKNKKQSCSIRSEISLSRKKGEERISTHKGKKYVDRCEISKSGPAVHRERKKKRPRNGDERIPMSRVDKGEKGVVQRVFRHPKAG